MNISTPANEPIIPQKGASRPMKIGVKLKLMAIGVPIRIWPNCGVRSTKGMGMSVTLTPANTSVKTGMPT